MKIKILVFLLVLFTAFGSQNAVLANLQQKIVTISSSSALSSQAVQSDQEEGVQMTPYQEALMNAIEDRKAKGLPVPESVSFSYEESTNSPSLFSIMASTIVPQTKTIMATTVIQYASPQQAGLEAWPAIVVENGELPPGMEGTIVAGDYTDQIEQEIKDQFPLFDQFYTFGQEPRQKVVTEEITINEPVLQDIFTTSLPLDKTETGKILMGKAFYGPDISFDKRVDWDWCFWGNCLELISARVFMQAHRYSGLRLPGSVSITGPESVSLGSPGNFSASFHPEDWDAAQYTAAGVAPEDGYEDISKFTIKADARVQIGAPGCWEDNDLSDCPDPTINISWGNATHLVTPLGPGTSFYPAPQGWIADPIDLGFLKIDMGIKFEPTKTSQKITADYEAVDGTDAVGSGTLIFQNADTPVSLNSIQACNAKPTGTGKIRLSNFRYYFTDYKLKVSTWFLLDFDDGTSWGDNWTTDVDFSWVFDNPIYGISHGAFKECNLSYQCTPVSTAYQQVEFTFNTVDQDKPKTEIYRIGTLGNNDWFTSEVMVELDSSDSPKDCGGGVVKTEYSLDGGDTWLTYTDPFKVLNEGKNVVSYRSIDKSGNIEDTQNENVWIDMTPPTINGAPTTLPNSYGWWNEDVIVHFEATDAISGISYVTPDVKITTEGADQSTTGKAYDVAGNFAQVTVSNINIDKTPPVVIITNTIYQVNEGGSVLLDGAQSYDPGGDALTDFIWDLNEDGVFEAPGNKTIFSAVGLNGPTEVDVFLKVCNVHGSCGIGQAKVKIENVAPTLGEITPTPLDPVVAAGTSVNLNAPFSDPAGDQDNPYNCAFDWDGNDSVDETISVTYGSCNTSHTYLVAGIYTVKLTVTDKDGGISNGSTFQYVVVYDPSAGFVTGGGWIYSAAGAYLPDSQLEGKANFGFVSKYQKNATVPTGNTEFQFKAGGLNFHSNSYEWLVVTGSNYAKFKGKGTINGALDSNGNAYKFMIWVGDGTATDGADTFRIKIWQEDESGIETVIYDNGFDQSIGGGSIVVHTGK